MDIRFAFAKFGATAHDRLPPGTLPTMDALFAPDPEPDNLASNPKPDNPHMLCDDNLFMLRDYVLSGDTIVATAIKAAGGIRLLARKLGIRPEDIERWKCIPTERLQAIARIAGLPQHVLRPDLFEVSAPQFYCTEEEADEIWKWSHAWQLWLSLPYPAGFLPAHCCARRVQLKLVTEVALPNV